MTLPSCRVRNPECGACGSETRSDGDVFFCEECRLHYGNGEEDTTAEYVDEDAAPCGKPCGNTWHGSRDLGPYDCRPCQLPTGHTSDCWTDCKPLPPHR